MRKNITLFMLFVGFSIYGQTKNLELKTHTFSEIEYLQQQNPKPIMVFVYTDWCKICFGMKKNTFKNKEVVNFLNKNFYFVKLNGEEKKDITFLGKTFTHKPTGNKTGTHQLAIELATIKGKISYPATTILNSRFEIDLQIDSYINSKKMTNLLKEYLHQ